VSNLYELHALEPGRDQVPLGQGKQINCPDLAVYVFSGQSLQLPVPGSHKVQ